MDWSTGLSLRQQYISYYSCPQLHRWHKPVNSMGLWNLDFIKPMPSGPPGSLPLTFVDRFHRHRFLLQWLLLVLLQSSGGQCTTADPSTFSLLFSPCLDSIILNTLNYLVKTKKRERRWGGRGEEGRKGRANVSELNPFFKSPFTGPILKLATPNPRGAFLPFLVSNSNLLSYCASFFSVAANFQGVFRRQLQAFIQLLRPTSPLLDLLFGAHFLLLKEKLSLALKEHRVFLPAQMLKPHLLSVPWGQFLVSKFSFCVSPVLFSWGSSPSRLC